NFPRISNKTNEIQRLGDQLGVTFVFFKVTPNLV
ncbi:MAG: hypothetical protein ACJA2M_002523, partial [Polaribacter sp.]